MVFLGLANPRRMKLRRGTFLRFGHRPVLRNLAKLLATISMICNTESAWRVTSVTAPARYYVLQKTAFLRMWYRSNINQT
jgi:hypothetical protein